MLKERSEFIRTSLYIIELLMVSVNFFIVYYFIAHHQSLYKLDLLPQWRVIQQPSTIDMYLRVYWLVLVIWAVLLKVKGEYHHLRIQTYRKVVTNQLVTGFLFFGIFTSSAFLLKFEFLSRLFMVLYSLTTVFWLLLNRLIILGVAYAIRRRGYNYRNIILVGTGKRAQRFMDIVARHNEWGYRVIGLLDKEAHWRGKSVSGIAVMGTLEDLPRLLDEHVVDEVVFVVPRSWLEEIEKCILYCEAVGVPATLSTDFFDLEIASGVPKELDGLNYVTFTTRILKEGELFVKRVFDVLFSSSILVISGPLLVATIIAIKASSKGPVFFKQTRCGLNGRKFTLYKLRSMVPDAEARLKELKAFNEMSGPVFKMANDPRLTSLGKFLRRTSLDEFPQFWNVLKGDMSIVGPRPPLPQEVEQYQPWQKRRLSMKPGITCTWQVLGRNRIDFEDWMKMDLRYIDRWSLWLDLKIFFMTVVAVLTRRGAG